MRQDSVLKSRVLNSKGFTGKRKHIGTWSGAQGPQEVRQEKSEWGKSLYVTTRAARFL